MKFRHTLAIGLRRDALDARQWKRLEATTGKLEVASRSRFPAAKTLRTVDCLLADLGEPVDRELLEKAPKLRYIGVFGTGYECIDGESASRGGVAVTNVPGYATEAVAEITLAAVLIELRNMRVAWSRAGRGAHRLAAATGMELRGRRFGIVGLGQIGQRVGELARLGFGAQVSYWSRTRKRAAEAAGIRYAALDEVLHQSQILSVNLALNPRTLGLLDARRISLIRRGALVICFAPLGLFETPALVGRLRSGAFVIALDDAEGLDPPLLRTLEALHNVAFYPPIGNTTQEATRTRREVFVSNVEAFVAGRPTNVLQWRPRQRRVPINPDPQAGRD